MQQGLLTTNVNSICVLSTWCIPFILFPAKVATNPVSPFVEENSIALHTMHSDYLLDNFWLFELVV